MKKKCKVVMLPSNKQGSINLGYGNVLYQGASLPSDNEHKNYHLYIVSQDEIKEDDYFMSAFYSYLLQNTKEWRDVQESMVKGSSDCSDLKFHKVIATTDLLLSPPTYKQNVGTYSTRLPQPFQQFIEYYVSEYNKGHVITEVMVEFEEKLIPNDANGGMGYPDEYINTLKINQDNTINIDVVKDSWNREEVVELLKRFRKETYNGYSAKKWIEENL